MHVYLALLSNLATYRKRRRTCRQTKSSFNQATKSMHPKTSCHKVHIDRHTLNYDTSIYKSQCSLSSC